MASSYFQFAPTIARNLASFDPNKPALLLLKVANLTGDFERDLGKKATALTPTLSSPQPQAGAMAGRLMNVLSSPLGVGPQETIRNFNPLPASPAAPTGASQGSFCPSLLLFEQGTHMVIGTFNIFTPLFNPTGLFNFVTTLNFEMLFNILVVLGLLYLFFTPPVSRLFPSSHLQELTITIRLEMMPPRTNRLVLWTPFSLVALNWVVRSPPPTLAVTLQLARPGQVDHERPGPPAI